MKKYIPFAFQGCGYVQDLELTEEVARLRIAVMQVKPNESSDEVILECKILPQLQERIRQLDRQYPVTEGVMVWFNTIFYRVGACFSDVGSKTPQGILMLRGELESVASWQQDRTGSYPL